MHGNNVDTSPLLGDSEVFTVKHAPRDTIPEPVQRFEYDGKVSSSVARQKPVDVFEDNGSRQTVSNEAHKFVKESRLAASKPRSRPHSRQADILAWEPSGPDFGGRDVFNFDIGNISLSRHQRPMLFKYIEAKRLYFTLKFYR